jgi:hypothetical protein
MPVRKKEVREERIREEEREERADSTRWLAV